MRARWIAVAAILLAGACTGSGQNLPVPAGTSLVAGPGVARALASRLQATLDQARTRADAPGAQAAVVFSDGSLWSGGSGLADVAVRRPVTPRTLFAIASITKTFTAALVLRLVEQGVLSLDDPLTKWIPDFPHGAGVTVR